MFTKKKIRFALPIFLGLAILIVVLSYPVLFKKLSSTSDSEKMYYTNGVLFQNMMNETEKPTKFMENYSPDDKKINMFIDFREDSYIIYRSDGSKQQFLYGKPMFSHTASLKNEENALYKRSIQQELSADELSFLQSQEEIAASDSKKQEELDSEFKKLSPGDIVTKSENLELYQVIEENSRGNRYVFEGKDYLYTFEWHPLYIDTFKLIDKTEFPTLAEQQANEKENKNNENTVKESKIINVSLGNDEILEYDVPENSFTFYKSRVKAASSLEKDPLTRKEIENKYLFSIEDELSAMRETLQSFASPEVIFIGDADNAFIFKEIGLEHLDVISLHDSRTAGKEVNKKALLAYLEQNKKGVVLVDNTTPKRLIEEVAAGRRVEYLDFTTDVSTPDAFKRNYLENLAAIKRSIDE